MNGAFERAPGEGTLGEETLDDGTPGKHTKMFLAMGVGLVLAACAGRDPHPVAVAQSQDAYSDCTMIRAEIEANNVQAEKLAEEARQQYLASLAEQRCARSAGPPPPYQPPRQ
jgi:hypothetical protein